MTKSSKLHSGGDTRACLLRRLQSLNEQELTLRVISPLMRALGFDRVEAQAGPYEAGRDLLCWKTDELGERRAFAVVVKRLASESGRVRSTTLASTIAQLEQTLSFPVPDADGHEHPLSSVFLITPSVINVNLLAQQFQRMRHLRGRDVRIIDGERLVQLLLQHAPQLSHSLSGAAATPSPPSPDDEKPLPAGVRRSKEKAAFDFLTGLYHELAEVIGSEQALDPTLCLVIMSFSESPSLCDFYEKAVKPTVAALGYKCERMDEQHFNGSITRQLLRNIRQARFIVADMTEARPNCYYELGIAHTLGKEVIHIANSADDVHFDVKNFNFIIYKRIDDLAVRLKERILNTVGPASTT